MKLWSVAGVSPKRARRDALNFARSRGRELESGKEHCVARRENTSSYKLASLLLFASVVPVLQA